MAAFPYHYWVAIRNEFMAEIEANNRAIEGLRDENTIEM